MRRIAILFVFCLFVTVDSALAQTPPPVQAPPPQTPPAAQQPAPAPPPLPVFPADAKVAFINLQAVVEQSALGKASSERIRKYDADKQAELQGKAKEFFERYESLAKPQGYKLKAMVINFPGGIPGDIGLFLNWAPPAV